MVADQLYTHSITDTDTKLLSDIGDAGDWSFLEIIKQIQLESAFQLFKKRNPAYG